MPSFWNSERVVVSACSEDFFAALPCMKSRAETFNVSLYRPAPDDWSVVVTDLQDSTEAVARGQHRTINFIAAAGIAAIRNVCVGIAIPVLFGGDGCVAMVPPGFADETRRTLARLRKMAHVEFGLTLRVGLAPIGDLRALGEQVLVGKYEPSASNAFGVFLGGAISSLERAMKHDPESPLSKAAFVPDVMDDPGTLDLTGLSCRWQELKSQNGMMLTLILDGADAPLAYEAIQRLTSRIDARPAKPTNLKAQWPFVGVWLEARSTHADAPVFVVATRLFARALVAYLVFKLGLHVRRFNPQRYIAEIARNTDFCKIDQQLSLVLDCDPVAEKALEIELKRLAEAGDLRFGFHRSPTALMTCLVSSAADSLHLHFIDGGDGGYTSASRTMRKVVLP
ncbi:DUF3095 family protein [Alsobacter sp. KACC 23698]|uniref:DUF3095 family protein n=1 Tax=Alsobacter sp. KACC 23698 TaxID=3149229 RepID=A0AAU7JHG7_9HYPH